MNRQIDTAKNEQNVTSWAKLKGWLLEFEIAMDYDAYSHANEKIECLKVELERLEVRVAALEKCREG